MNLLFKDKTIRLVIVEANATLRQILADSFRAAGYKNTQALAGLDEAKAFVETEHFDWMILPFGLDQPVSGFSFLRLTVEYPEFKSIRVSFLIDQNEEELLPKSFEFGALNYFQKPITKDSFTAELAEFEKRMEQCQYQEPLLASLYLYDVLKKSNAQQEMLTLSKKMLELYPGHFEVMKRLVESCHINNLTDLAKSYYAQSLLIHINEKKQLEDLAQKTFGTTDVKVEGAEAMGNVLNLKSVVLIDKDETERTKVKGVLAELGLTAVSEFSDGEEAWKYIEQQATLDLLICEWKIPSLTGPFLIQRVRQKFPEAPIMIQSSIIKPTDMPLIRELGVANLVGKPIERDLFLKNLIWTIQQDRSPADQMASENKFFGLVHAKKVDEARSLMTSYCDNIQFPKSRKAMLQAEFALCESQYVKARDFAVQALKLMPENVIALNTLGKALMNLRQYPAALKCFQKAQSFSPNNLDRLCLLAETNAEIGNEQASKESLEQAKNLDSQSTVVQEAEVKVALAKNDLGKAKELMGQIESLNKLISYLNNKAVAHAKSGFTAEGIALYDNTLQSIPDNRPDLKSRVLYNISLAKIRENKIDEAIENLKTIIQDPSAPVLAKARSLLKRCEEAKTKNIAIMLRENDTPAASVTTENVGVSQDAVETMLEISLGEKALYLIFKGETPVPETLKKCLEQSLAAFKRRSAIERGPTLNAAA